MTDYLTEQEQIELLKSWIKQYSLVIIVGVLISIATISGWRYWQQRQNKIISHASSVFDEMLIKRSQNNAQADQIQADKLFKHYANTTYGPFAALMLAREAVNKGDLVEAENQLQWALKHSSIASIRQIARLRLARIYIAENKLEDSLNIIKKIEDKSFNGLIAEVKGDIYLAKKNIDMARESYHQALEDLPNAEVIRPLLQMKHDNLVTQYDA